MERNLKTPEDIALSFHQLLTPSIKDPSQPAFWVWARQDRAVISVNPANIKNIGRVLSNDFQHHLSTILGGVRVVRTNSIGIYYQIGYTQQPAVKLQFIPLDLSSQPGPTHLPIGMTAKGPLWLDLIEIDSLLIGGPRRKGKTRILHGMIQALIAGGACNLMLWDGKSGNEFDRYQGKPRVTVVPDGNLSDALASVKAEVSRRAALFGSVGATNLASYNQTAIDQLPLLVLILDEVADLDQTALDHLTDLVRRAGAYGVHPIVGIQRPDADVLPGQLRANFVTRISLPVAKPEESKVILGFGGAEKIAKEPGRLLINFGSQHIEAHAFFVDLPNPSAPALTPDERNLLARGRDESSGRLSIPLLKSWGVKEWRARGLLDDLESRGYLLRDTGTNTRSLTARALEHITQASQAPSNNPQGPSSPLKPPSRLAYILSHAEEPA